MHGFVALRFDEQQIGVLYCMCACVMCVCAFEGGISLPVKSKCKSCVNVEREEQDWLDVEGCSPT